MVPFARSNSMPSQGIENYQRIGGRPADSHTALAVECDLDTRQWRKLEAFQFRYKVNWVELHHGELGPVCRYHFQHGGPCTGFYYRNAHCFEYGPVLDPISRRRGFELRKSSTVLTL